jgi:predicted RNA-binding protein YlxR (DUF448 family)
MRERRRTCVGCREQKSPDALVRIVRLGDGSLVASVASQGRGAWLCSGSVSCFGRASRSRAFDRALRCEIGTPALEALARSLGLENT